MEERELQEAQDVQIPFTQGMVEQTVVLGEQVGHADKIATAMLRVVEELAILGEVRARLHMCLQVTLDKPAQVGF